MGVELFLLAAFGAMIFWGFGDFLLQKSIRKIGDVEALFFTTLIGVVGFFPLVYSGISSLSSADILILVFLGLITFVVALFTLEAFKKGKISVIEVLLEFELPLTIVLGFFLLSETLSFIQFILIIPIFLGIVLIAVKDFSHFKKHHIKIEKGVFLAIVAAIGFAFINFLTGFSARSISPVFAIWLPWLAVVVVCTFVIISRKDGKKLVSNAKKFKWLILIVGIFEALAWLLYSVSMSWLNIGLITAITESYPAIAIALGVLINKERVHKHQWLGALMTIFASLALAITLL